MTTHKKETAVLDKIPAWLRHLLLLMFAAAISVLIQVPATGWDRALGGRAVDAAVGAGLAFLVLLLTPLTKQYGVGQAATPPRIN